MPTKCSKRSNIADRVRYGTNRLIKQELLGRVRLAESLLSGSSRLWRSLPDSLCSWVDLVGWVFLLEVDLPEDVGWAGNEGPGEEEEECRYGEVERFLLEVSNCRANAPQP